LRLVEEWPELRLTLMQSSVCLPRLRGVERVLAAANPGVAQRLIGSESFDPIREAVVEGAADETFQPLTFESLQIGKRAARGTARVPAGGGFAVFSAANAPGWHVTVDGAPAKLENVNLGTLGVRLPEGTHEVEFSYSERWAGVGAVLSA